VSRAASKGFNEDPYIAVVVYVIREASAQRICIVRHNDVKKSVNNTRNQSSEDRVIDVHHLADRRSPLIGLLIAPFMDMLNPLSNSSDK